MAIGMTVEIHRRNKSSWIVANLGLEIDLFDYLGHQDCLNRKVAACMLPISSVYRPLC